MARFLRFLPLAFMTVALSMYSIGCNTMEGAGEDIEDAGDELKDAAD